MLEQMNFSALNFRKYAVTIADGTAVSDSIESMPNTKLQSISRVAVKTPSTWTAADIAFDVSHDGTTWVRVAEENGGLALITNVETAEARVYLAPVSTWILSMFRYFRIRSANTTTGADENQVGADRDLEVVLLYN